MTTATRVVDVLGRRLMLAHLDEALWPEEGVTKGELLDYYTDVAGHLLPLIAQRPLSLQRAPDPVTGECVYQKTAPPGLPPWIPTRRIRSEHAALGYADHVIGGDLPALLYLLNLGFISLHPWSCTVDALDRPDQLLFDLDPTEIAFREVRNASRMWDVTLGQIETTTIAGAVAVAVVLPARAAWGQGRILTRQSAPVLGAQGSPYLDAAQWQASVGYRWQKSDRHFTGDTEDRERAEEGSQVINDMHLIDLGATYAVTQRLNTTLSLPILVASRSQAIRDLHHRLAAGNALGDRGEKRPGKRISAALRDQVPVEGLEMTEIENDPVALGNGSFIKGLRPDQAEQDIGVCTSVSQHLCETSCRGYLCDHRLASEPRPGLVTITPSRVLSHHFGLPPGYICSGST